MIGEKRQRHRDAHLMTESELQGVVVRIAQEQGWMVKPAQQGSQRARNHYSALRNSTANGFPDLIAVRDGEMLVLELKDQDGKLSISQDAWSLALGPSGRYLYEALRPSDLSRGRVEELLS